MKNHSVEPKHKKIKGPAKRLIALVLAVALVFSTLTPTYARSGNYGNSSAFSQTISGAYSSAQVSSTISWTDLVVNSAVSIAVEAADLWYYNNYYGDYGKALISFDIGGTRVDISRGQMFRMVASVAAQSIAGLATGQGISVGAVVDRCVKEFVSLLVQEIVRDILVRKLGMDSTMAGLIASVASKLVSEILAKYYVSANEEREDKEGLPVEPNGLGAAIDRLIDPEGKQLKNSKDFVKGLATGIGNLVRNGNYRNDKRNISLTADQLKAGKKYAEAVKSDAEKRLKNLEANQNKYSKGFYVRKERELNEKIGGYKEFIKCLDEGIKKLEGNVSAKDGSPVTVPANAVIAGMVSGFLAAQEKSQKEANRRHFQPEADSLRSATINAAIRGIGMVKGPEEADKARKTVELSRIGRTVNYTGGFKDGEPKDKVAFQKAVDQYNKNMAIAQKISFDYNPRNPNNQAEFKKALDKSNATSAPNAPGKPAQDPSGEGTSAPSKQKETPTSGVNNEAIPQTGGPVDKPKVSNEDQKPKDDAPEGVRSPNTIYLSPEDSERMWDNHQKWVETEKEIRSLVSDFEKTGDTGKLHKLNEEYGSGARSLGLGELKNYNPDKFIERLKESPTLDYDAMKSLGDLVDLDNVEAGKSLRNLDIQPILNKQKDDWEKIHLLKYFADHGNPSAMARLLQGEGGKTEAEFAQLKYANAYNGASESSIAPLAREKFLGDLSTTTPVDQAGKEFKDTYLNAEKLNITYPFRFDYPTMKELVKNRTENGPGDTRPVAIVTANRDDDTGAFSEQFVDQKKITTTLVNQGYRVMYYEASNMQEIISSVKDGAGDKIPPLWVISGHGSKGTAAFGPQSYLDQFFGVRGADSQISTENVHKLSELREYLGPDTQVILYSCSTGESKASDSNLANAIRKELPNVGAIYSPTAPTTGVIPQFDSSTGSMTNAVFTFGDQLGETYKNNNVNVK